MNDQLLDSAAAGTSEPDIIQSTKSVQGLLDPPVPPPRTKRKTKTKAPIPPTILESTTVCSVWY